MTRTTPGGQGGTMPDKYATNGTVTLVPRAIADSPRNFFRTSKKSSYPVLAICSSLIFGSLPDDVTQRVIGVFGLRRQAINIELSGVGPLSVRPGNHYLVPTGEQCILRSKVCPAIAFTRVQRVKRLPFAELEIVNTYVLNSLCFRDGDYFNSNFAVAASPPPRQPEAVRCAFCDIG